MNTQRVEGHTPTPWKLWSGGEDGHILSIYYKREDDVIHWTGFDNSVISDAEKIRINKANAAFIVHACNNIERLEKVNEALVKYAEQVRDCKYVPDYVHEWSEAVLRLAKELA